MKVESSRLPERRKAIARYLPSAAFLIAVCILTACSTTTVTGDATYSLGIEKGEILITVTPCYYMDYPGTRTLKPIDGRYMSQPFTYEQYLAGEARGFDAEHVAGVIPSGTRIRYTGVFSETSFMTDTRIRYRGRIEDGKFKGKRVTLNAMIDREYAQGHPSTLAGQYLRQYREPTTTRE